MSDRRIERTHYFAGEALLTSDFQVEQNYNMTMLRNHNRSLHTYGIARGLEVLHDTHADANQVEIAPGTAIDRLGREIILVDRVVMRITDPTPGANYYLTITYDEVYGDYTDESGVPGYKRVILQPKIAYGLNLSDPGLHLLLAVIGFSSQGAINSLTYKSGSFERRYVGSVLGTVAFVTEGSGVVLDAQANSVEHLSTSGLLSVGGPTEADRYASISARRDTTALPGQASDYLLVDAPRTQFSGLATTRGNLGIGIDQPVANLQIDALSFKGPGMLTSDGPLVTLSQPVQPYLQVGDMLTSDPTVTLASQTRTITGVNPEHLQVTVDSAFNPTLSNASYTYTRAHLASFSSSAAGSLFQVGFDGSIGLGKQAAVRAGQPSSGPNALVISPDRCVGIGLASATPQAELDVNGAVRANSATIAGKVVAGSFEGNGSKLVGLPILSFWTQESPGDPNSKLHYLPGNVGVRMSNPPASLGVGGGYSQIGSGLVTAAAPVTTNGLTLVTLTGYLTQFTKDVSIGDTLTVGTIVDMPLLVNTIASDTSLTLTSQPPFVLYDWPYEVQPVNGPKRPGNGKLSSSGTQITGTGTSFRTDLQPGDQLIIKELQTTGGQLQSWYVNEVKSDTEMTIRRPVGSTADFDANRSAFMVTQALLAQFQQQDTSMPPAMQITTNAVSALTPDMAPNTVTINVPLEGIDPTYALQVNGDVNFTGGGGSGTVTVQTLVATRNIAVKGDGTAALLLSVAEAGAAASVLGVTKDNVVLGQDSGDSTYILDAKGSLHASGNVVAGQTVSAHTLSAPNLSVSGSKINSNGSVQIIGPRAGPYSKTDMTNSSSVSCKFTQTASTDGYVLATVGSVADQFAFFGYLEGVSQLNGATTSYAYAAAVCYPFKTGEDKKGHGGTTYYPTVPGSFTLPVRAGESWTLTLTWMPSGSGLSAPSVEFYWVPLGTAVSSGGLAAAAPSAAPSAPTAPLASEARGAEVAPKPSPMEQAMSALREKIESGEIGGGSMEAAQRTIDQRVGDLAKVLGDATRMSNEPEDRNAFIKELQHIVCKASLPGQTPDNAVDPTHIESLVDTFGRVTGREFTPPQRDLLAQGVRALVQINDNDKNRHDLNLIKGNIDQFIDNVGRVLGTDFSSAERRLLTRALVRLVGDGSNQPAGEGGEVLPSSGLQPITWPPLAPVPAPATAPAHTEAAHGFVQDVEHLLGQALHDDGKAGLHKIIDDIAARRPVRQVAEGLLKDGVEGVTKGLLTGPAREALGGAIGKLLEVLL